MNTQTKNWVRVFIHLAFLRPICRIVFGVTLRGRENIPRDESFVLVANHNSHLDVLLAFLTVPLHRISHTHVVASREYFSVNPVLFWFVNFLFQPIWVGPKKRNGRSIAAMGGILDEGENIIVFPEGTRGRPGEIGRFKTGVGVLLQNRVNVKVVPVFMLGPERVLPKETACPLPISNHITIGAAQKCVGNPVEITDRLRGAICELENETKAKRHRRPRTRKPPVSIAVLGIDGSGKSTVAKQLSLRLSRDNRTCLIGDGTSVFHSGQRREVTPVLWEWVRGVLNRRVKKAKSLRRYKIPKLTELLIRNKVHLEAERWYEPSFVLMDGSPLFNLTAWSALYTKEGMSDRLRADAMSILSGRWDLAKEPGIVLERIKELKALKSLGLAKLKLPDVVLFLDVDPKTSMNRIEARGEAVQAHETVEKLSRLRKSYQDTIRIAQATFDIKIRGIDANKTLSEVVEDSLGIVRGEIGGSF